MEISIEQIIEGRKRHVKLEEDEYQKLSEEIKQLEDTEVIKTYLERRKLLEIARERLKKKNHEYTKEIQESCSHPLFNLVYGKHYVTYATINYSIQCTLCGKIIDMPESSYRTLYEKRRLIAVHDYTYDYWEGRGYNKYSPTRYTTAEIRKYYYQLYLKLKKLSEMQIDGIEIPNIEHLVWEEFCGDKTKPKKLTKRYNM